MVFALQELGELNRAGFDEIIDVRSPTEFAEDHVPGAISLPVLSDNERAEVGTIYKQGSPFEARKIGAALIARNISRHLETHFADKPRDYRPLVYCWRGGQRSRSMAIILSQIGWRAETLEDGYKQYRRLVVKLLYDGEAGSFAFRGQFVLIDGNTGTGKTRLLSALAEAGAQVIDLEGIGRHRGSVFGALAEAQPSQKAFDSGIAAQLAGFDPQRPVFLEAESNRIGRLTLPKMLWQEMCRSPRIGIEAGLPARARYLVREYADVAADLGLLLERIGKLKPYQPSARLDGWRELARSGALETLAAELMTHHYDPTYSRQRARGDWQEIGRIKLGEIDAAELACAAREVMKLAGDIETA